MLSTALAYGPHSDRNTERQQPLPQYVRGSGHASLIQPGTRSAWHGIHHPVVGRGGYTGKPVLPAAGEE